MLHLYSWGTPNGRKIFIMLEELGVPYESHPVNIGKDEQFDPEFLKISPNNKIPALVDDEAGLSLFESGAILIYLAEKFGKFLPEGNDRHTAIQWLMWQMGGLGPMMGQLGWFVVSDKEATPVGVERYARETARLFNVLEKQLSQQAYVAGDDYTIADIAIYPWLAQYRVRVKDYVEPMLQARPHILAWLDKVGARPAVIAGMKLP
ncbi:MAG TPA: glutathione S-transferase N-terminal domain-containing protein [Asticcacaulis sp.]|nr:glutathione S-transferase N-terminal domain-containing protein [Asticcacaulis sp.]